MKDFIGLYPEAVDGELCDWLCRVADQSSFVCLDNNTADRNDTQIILESFHPTQANDLVASVNKCLMDYVTTVVPFLSDKMFVSSITLLQKTEPMGGGFHNFHCEDQGWNVAHRTMAWMVYLNDVEDGGETEFIYQQKRFKPERGSVLLWPASYTHMHRGNPPLTNKYIATGWYQADTGTVYEHIIKKN